MKTFGSMKIASISGGRFRLDGGNMFGVVPKALWQRKCPADESNRIQMDTSCLLIETQGKRVLIDTGYGSKLPEKSRKNFEAEEGNPLLRSLAALDVQPQSIDIVLLTHLHFDHAGGCTQVDSGTLRPVFPHAKYIVQQSEWDDATGNLPWLAGSYFVDDFVPVQEAGQLELIDGDVEILPRIRVEVSGGHTRGHQVVFIGEGDSQGVFLADICPTTWHLNPFWTMAYDQSLIDLRKAKLRLLSQAAEQGLTVFLDHDPEVAACKLRTDDREGFAVDEIVPL